MANPASTVDQNLLPVQAYFDVNGNFQTFIGQGKPFTATISPDQSGLHITNSTIDSTTIGATTPSTGVFSSGKVNATPVTATDIANKLYVDSVAVGISWKAPVTAATTANITLSGVQTIDGVTLVAGNTVLVKNQSTSSENGIYTVNAGAWTYAPGSTTWAQYVSALVFVEYGGQAGSAWYCTAQPGGTLGVTAMTWSNFSTAANYTAGTGLTLSGYQFSITNTGVAANTYGSATATPVFAVNAQGQITSVTNTTITPAIGNVTGLATGMATFLQTPTSANLAATVSDETGSGALVFATSPTLVTPALGSPASGNFTSGTFTWPTFNQNTTGYAGGLAGGATGSLPYQSATNTTTFLAAGSNGQVLTLTAGVPSWTNPSATGVTSVSGTGTVSGITLSGTVTSTGSLTLGGTLDLSSPPTIGNTTPNTISGTTITATTQFSGAGTGLTGTASGLSIGGNAATATSATTATNLAGGATGSVPYQTGSGATTFLAAGTNGYVLTLAGGVPTWAAAAGGLTISDDTTTNATRYPVFSSATSGSVSTEYVSSTKYQYNPSVGTLTAPQIYASNGLVLNSNTNTASFTIPTNQNAMSVGPFTTASGTTITVSAGSRWVVL